MATDSLSKHDYKKYISSQHGEGDRAGRLLAWLVNREEGLHTITSVEQQDGALTHTQLGINHAF